MDPVFIEIFGRPIYWYGVLTALGFLAAVIHLGWLGRRDGRPEGLASELGIWVMVGGILGARVAYVLSALDEYAANPLEIIRIDKGGLIYYGGFIGATLGIVLLARLKRKPLWNFGDFVITAVPLGHAVGRVGCFLNGCCFGTNCAVPWSAHRHDLTQGDTPSFQHPNDFLHPTQLYETGLNLAVYATLLWYYRRKRRDGTVLALYLTLYPIVRFTMEFLRGDPRMYWMGLTVAQALSLALLAVACVFWIFLPRRPAAGDE